MLKHVLDRRILSPSPSVGKGFACSLKIGPLREQSAFLTEKGNPYIVKLQMCRQQKRFSSVLAVHLFFPAITGEIQNSTEG